MGNVVISYENLLQLAGRILEGCVSAEDALVIARVLTEADAMGIGSHGVAKLAGYVRTYELGWSPPRPI
jgi:LDH2 family malate/lactate/ureidoglycolate dehydrogenase